MDDLKYMLNPNKRKAVAHMFTGGDTLCRMYSTGGMNKIKMHLFTDQQGRELCSMCSNVFRGAVNAAIGNIQQKSKSFRFKSGHGRIDLQCPFAEKDWAKSLGAKWDQAKKTWFIVDVEDITPFMRWIRADQKPSTSKASYANHI